MIPGVPSMGGGELLIILAVVLLFFGAKRVPELSRSLGRGMREFREGTKGGEEDPDNKEDETRELRQKRELAREEEAQVVEGAEAHAQTGRENARGEWRTERKP
jgi:sec-independent protein translocase protein TatA